MLSVTIRLVGLEGVIIDFNELKVSKTIKNLYLQLHTIIKFEAEVKPLIVGGAMGQRRVVCDLIKVRKIEIINEERF